MINQINLWFRTGYRLEEAERLGFEEELRELLSQILQVKEMNPQVQVQHLGKKELVELQVKLEWLILDIQRFNYKFLTQKEMIEELRNNPSPERIKDERYQFRP